MVAATTLDGRFPGIAVPLVEDEVLDLLGALRERGRGYLEISHQYVDWPMLAVGVEGETAVVHHFVAPESVSLLKAAGPAADGTVEVPIMGEWVSFDRSYAVSWETACVVVEHFLLRDPTMNAYGWQPL